MSDGIRDIRSPLAKALGGSVAWTRVRVASGRLQHVAIGLRSLSQDRIQAAVRSAVEYLTEACRWRDEQLYTELGEAVYDTETQVRVLAEALIVPPETDEAVLTTGDVQPLVSGPDDLRALLEPDEVSVLYTAFVRWQRERSPLTRATTREEVEAFVEGLGKGMIPVSRLSTCEPASLLAIATSLAARLPTWTKPRSSRGSPSSAPRPTSAPGSDSPPSGESPTDTIEVATTRSPR